MKVSLRELSSGSFRIKSGVEGGTFNLRFKWHRSIENTMRLKRFAGRSLGQKPPTGKRAGCKKMLVKGGNGLERNSQSQSGNIVSDKWIKPLWLLWADYTPSFIR